MYAQAHNENTHLACINTLVSKFLAHLKFSDLVVCHILRVEKLAILHFPI